MRAILIHGMGRTPLSMALLAIRLRLAGISPHLYGYSAAFEGWVDCSDRLKTFIETRTGQSDYIVVGHSLGSVLARAAIPRLERRPLALFLLAPPTVACAAARKFSSFRLYRWVTGEMGQLLSKSSFMESISQPDVPMKIYSGVAGGVGIGLPFGNQENDGLLALSETQLPEVTMMRVHSTHTFIMNSVAVAKDIIRLSMGEQPSVSGDTQ